MPKKEIKPPDFCDLNFITSEIKFYGHYNSKFTKTERGTRQITWELEEIEIELTVKEKITFLIERLKSML